MRMTTLAGGVGSARLLAGLVQIVDPPDLTVVVNTGDDDTVRGLHLSPDIDTVLYHLAGLEDWERGWGMGGDSFSGQHRYEELSSKLPLTGSDVQGWIALGDRDLATKLLRTQLLHAGHTLSEATDAIRTAMGIGCRVLPMSDDPVRTVLTGADGRLFAFQEWFVRLRQSPAVVEVHYRGADEAGPAPGVVDAIRDAEVVVIPPSNPLLSVAPALALPELREALGASRATRVAVSPIIGGRALKGPADRLMRSMGHEVSPAGVAALYAGLVDVFVIDERDAPFTGPVESLGMRAVVTDSVMRSAPDAARLAKVVMDAAV